MTPTTPINIAKIMTFLLPNFLIKGTATAYDPIAIPKTPELDKSIDLPWPSEAPHPSFKPKALSIGCMQDKT